jgi:predicted transcriptional regulator
MMAVTQDDIDALKAAIWAGARTVKFGSGADSREVTYRSLDEMRSILSDMNAELTGGSFSPISYAAHSRY